ncbi:MAG: 30S ribosomal protein S3 [Sweet potato little leaf phytoplasma]|uniref:Small ribosomal subunit protein uS3 n=48 Tax=Candidatus Phytoplasma TaxID=33926 RepID=A0A4D6G016_9MOLU|nr:MULTISPECIES: 30S ribosomal protein S3 [Phytoplasma]ABO26506.1 ribosomal protein S3 [Alfalfa witches'-broom phytoplasma]ABO26510.1 ribosomal protein S3 [Tomato big bud phytoplasma (Australia)]ABO26514.1 ribosomal protein S3 [Peanut witches'-broom phytoplasma]ABO26516.1 ribosomal protein S3 [Sweet potato witches'-broom phytoplasma]ABZ04074.1 ribosomal protein S3 [Cleome witches'-broom phytoplasma]AEN14598.1 ribosomal protein S3 [Tephrosia witches'-broom phytoplasma]ASM93557.1 ribosomal pro
MGQKSSPIILRLSLLRNWSSNWYAEDKKVPLLINEDYRIRNFINNYYPLGTIARVEIQRLKKENEENIEIFLHTPKIGVVVGSDNKEKNKLVQEVYKLIKKNINIHVIEVKNPEKVASLIAQNIAAQLQQRAFFRAVKKMYIQKALKAGVKGIKISLKGRLSGAEIARTETTIKGILPLGTFRSKIDYAYVAAKTIHGVLGVKVWVCDGNYSPKDDREISKTISRENISNSKPENQVNK